MLFPSINRLARDGADDEAGDVVLAVGVEARHLGGFAAEQGATVLTARRGEPVDDLDRDIRIQPPGGKVVEEEQRLGALDEDVVDAVVDEVATDRSVIAGHEGDLQLRADAVRARDEHRILETGGIQREQPAKRADVRQDAGREGALRERADTSDDFVPGVDINAGLAVIHGLVLSDLLELEPFDECSAVRRVAEPGACQ